MSEHKKRYDFNQLTISGRVGKDPEFRTTSTGKDMAKFSVAMSEKGQGDNEKTTWLMVTCFGNAVAALHEKGVRRGDPIKLRGRLDINEWTNNAGEKQKIIGIVVFNDVDIATGKDRLPDPVRPQYNKPAEQERPDGRGNQSAGYNRRGDAPPAVGDGPAFEDEEIPF